jgi:hypothetical protein
MLSFRCPAVGKSIGRREFLQLGSLGTVGLTLPTLLRAGSTPVATAGSSFGRAKRCLLVFLNGGPSQLDTWDMKPLAPADVRGELQPIPTNVLGIDICELMPLLAQQADKFKIVRSVTHPCVVHTTGVYTMLTGSIHPTPAVDQIRVSPEDHPHFGAVFAKWQGWRQGRPPFVSLPRIFRAPPVEGIWAGQNAGFLGRRYDPFVVLGDRTTAKFRLPDVELPTDLNGQRLLDRRTLLQRVNASFRSAEQTWDDFDTFYQQAFALLATSGVRDAVDLNREPAAMRDRYGRHLFGQGLLLARRLFEAGLPLVTVGWTDVEPPGEGGGEYDSHGRIYHHMRKRLVAPTDRGLAALFGDLAERGLLDDTLVVVMGEFGRTPRINAQAGRDHWPWTQSILLAGAGVSGGSLFGSTDREAAYPASHPVSPPDLAQTILHLLGVPSDLMLSDAQGRPVKACQGAALAGLYA